MLSDTRTAAPSLDRPQESGIEGAAGTWIRCVHFSTDGGAGSVRNPLRYGESCVSGACPRMAVHVTRLRRENFPCPCASGAQGRNGLQEFDRTCCSLEVVAHAADAPRNAPATNGRTLAPLQNADGILLAITDRESRMVGTACRLPVDRHEARRFGHMRRAARSNVLAALGNSC